MTMNLTLFSDPHIGLVRTSHTTVESRRRLQRDILQTVESILSRGKRTICLGDLFDTYTVDNVSLYEGLHVYQQCELVLHGNHDLANRLDTMSSIELLYVVKNGPYTQHPANSPDISQAAILGPGKPKIVWVDHKLNQTLFDEALAQAFEIGTGSDILLLHCNYESPFADQESTLNLSREQAEVLLKRYSHIFIGHEHNSRTDFDGRLVLVGNTHPTSFSDISDKLIWHLKFGDNGVEHLSSEVIWSREQGYRKFTWQELSELSTLPSSVQFVDIVGEADDRVAPVIAKQVADLWKLSDNLRMVRNNVNTAKAIEQFDTEVTTRCQSVPERISTDLKDNILGEVWASYLSRL